MAEANIDPKLDLASQDLSSTPMSPPTASSSGITKKKKSKAKKSTTTVESTSSPPEPVCTKIEPPSLSSSGTKKKESKSTKGTTTSSPSSSKELVSSNLDLASQSPPSASTSKKAKSKKSTATATLAQSTSTSTLTQAQISAAFQQDEVHCWDNYLKKSNNAQWICGVEYFEHAPFGSGSNKWLNYAQPGMVIEVPNYKCPTDYWPATVIGFAGYSALVEYVRVDERKSDGPYKCWFPFCSRVPKPLGYCLSNDILLRPVSDIDKKDRHFLKKTFTKLAAKNLPTIKPEHWEYCLEELKSTATRFKLNELVEALDKLDCGKTRMGIVSMTLGNRIHVQYLGMEDDDEGFWFSQQSEHVHKMGWSHAVGIEVLGARSDLAYPVPPPSEFPPVPAGVEIVRDAMFEMRHPVHLHKICAAFIVKPLQHGYFVAGTDWTREEESVDVVMHVTSDYVLPINFCRKHDIHLELPKKNGKQIMNFSWRKYLPEVDCPALDLSAIKKEKAKFTKGCKMEAVDLRGPTYLGPATVTDVCGHLLQIRFDGFPRADEESYQWVSARSPDIYPACYSQFIGHKLGGQPDVPNPADYTCFTDPEEPSTSSRSSSC